MFVENPLTDEEWADEAEWLVERDRLTGRVLRAWSHVEWRVLMLLENFVPHPRYDFAGQLWAGAPSFPAKLDMVTRLGHGHLPEHQLEELHRLMAACQRHHAKVATIAHHRVCQAYFVEDAHDRSFVEEESLQLQSWIAELHALAKEIATFTARNTFRKGQLAYAVRRGPEFRLRYGAPEAYAPALYAPAPAQQPAAALAPAIEDAREDSHTENGHAEDERVEEEADDFYTVPTLQGVLAAEAARVSLS